jgi:2,5-diketo-D-gluconate reductase A
VTQIADRHGRTPAQIVLRWHLELGLIPIPKTASVERMKSNIDVFDFSLSPAETAALSALDRGEDAATDSDSVGH